MEINLCEIAINFFHVISLLWEKTTRKYTNDFIIYKIREILESVSNMVEDEQTLQLIYADIKESKRSLQEANISVEYCIGTLGSEVDNHENNQYRVPLDWKLTILLYLAEKVAGITEEQIFEKYQN